MLKYDGALNFWVFYFVVAKMSVYDIYIGFSADLSYSILIIRHAFQSILIIRHVFQSMQVLHMHLSSSIGFLL